MGVNITYMGTKRALAPAVSDVMRYTQPGTMLDAFSGMCSVGEAIGATRQVWSNDAQIFAAEVAKALFSSRQIPLSPLSYGDIHFENFRKQYELLATAYASSFKVESALLKCASFSTFEVTLAKLKRVISNDAAQCRLRSPHLFAKIYSGTFFGVKQAIEADSIYAAMNVAKRGGAIDSDGFRWGLIALGRALLKVSNSTGHFAQYLKPKLNTYTRYLALRKRSLWEEWLESIGALAPVGEANWRNGNKVFNQDTLTLIPRLARNNTEVSVIYADPPYTDDQYSRYYHILETLCLYDYPKVTGAGLYRPDRFQTLFSQKSKASAAITKLITASARTGADLVLSYPTNGLAVEAGTDIKAVLKAHFRRVEVCYSMAHNHSTFGASKGSAKFAATELIYLARSA